MAENWRELMDDPEVHTIIEQTWRTHGHRYYWRRADALALDDLASWLWDHAVDCAMSHDPSHFEDVESPRDLFRAVLSTNLRKAIVDGWHRTHFYGTPGTERRFQSTRQTSFEALVESMPNDRGTGDRGVEGLFLANHVTHRDDPLTILIRREHLEQLLRHAKVRAIRGTTVTRDPDPYCSEPMCLRPILQARLCSMHYQRYREQWVSQPCSVDGCTKGAVGKGLCGNHLKMAYKTDPDRPRCAHPDTCDRAATKRGLCEKHYLAARKAGTLPPRERPKVCTADGCDAAVYAKALCRPHYNASRRNQGLR